MWSAGSKKFIVYLGTRLLLVSRGGVTELTRPIESVDDGLTLLEEHLAKSEGRKVLDVFLSGSLCRATLVAAIEGAQGRSAQRQAASAIAVKRTGWSNTAQTRSQSAGRDGANVVAVLDPSLPASLDAFAKRARCRLARVRPFWAAASRLDGTAPATDSEATLLAVQDCDSLTVLVGNDRQLTRAESLAPLTSAERAEAALARVFFSTDDAVNVRRVLRLSAEPVPAATPLAGVAFSAHLEQVQ